MLTRAWHTTARMTLGAVVLFPMWLGYAVLFFRVRRFAFRPDTARLSRMHRRNARRFYRLAVRLRGGLIKVGQIMSTRFDLMPAEWLEELSGLQDEVEPTPWEALVDHVRAGYDEPLDALFETLSEEAHAAASFGQVHRGRTKDGVDVALKIKYPDVELKLAVDMAIFRVAVRLFNIFLPRVDLGSIYTEIRRALTTELDYEQEARFTQIIHDNFEGREGVVIPRVIEELTTRDVICTTWVDGVKITSEQLRARDIDRRVLLERLLGAWIQMMYVDGVFQSDPHPGNLLVSVVDGEPIVGVVDFGQVKILERAFHEKIVRGAMAFAMGNLDMFMTSLVEIGLFEEDKRAIVEPKVELLMKRLRDETPVDVGELDFPRIRDEVMSTIDEMDGIVIPQELVLYGRTFALLAGVTRAVAPDLNAIAVAKPLMMQAMLAGGPPARADSSLS